MIDHPFNNGALSGPAPSIPGPASTNPLQRFEDETRDGLTGWKF